MPTIFETLLTASGAKLAARRANENTESYLRRLVAVLGGISKDAFEALPQGAQDWFDRAQDALMSGVPVPLPEGLAEGKPAPVPPLVIQRPRSAGTPPLVRRPGQAAALSESTVSIERPPAAGTEGTEEGERRKAREPVAMTVARLLIEDREITLDAMMQRLEAMRVRTNRSTVGTLRYNFRCLLEIATSAGWQPPA